LEVHGEAVASDVCAVAVAIEVVRRADARCGETVDELPCTHAVTMLMSVMRRIGALAALCVGVGTASAHAAAPPQGYQSVAAFAGSYAARHVTSVTATTQKVSCYAPEVLVLLGLTPAEGFPQGGGTPCPGPTTGESVGPYATQDVKSPALLVKDHSESDLRID